MKFDMVGHGNGTTLEVKEIISLAGFVISDEDCTSGLFSKLSIMLWLHDERVSGTAKWVHVSQVHRSII